MTTWREHLQKLAPQTWKDFTAPFQIVQFY
uniref:Uncharacterized protein n=1 Tax=Arundo donax TaxID=35708 RepID=A0A0A9E4Z2_ARUDO